MMKEENGRKGDGGREGREKRGEGPHQEFQGPH